MKYTLVILGAGGHGRVVADAALCTSKFEEIVFLDDKYPDVVTADMWPVIGKTKDIYSLQKQGMLAIVAIGNNKSRLEHQCEIEKQGYEIATIIHPSAQVSSTVSIGKGSVIFANCVLNIGTIVGRAVIVNTAATIDHDCNIEDGVHISPGAHLAGAVRGGSCSWVGIGASVIHECKIGANVIVGAGAAVINNIADNKTIVGVPARPVS